MSFRHEGPEVLYRTGSKMGVRADHVPKLRRILTALEVAESPADLAISVTEAADRLGVTRVTLSRVVNGHAGVSPGLAVRLEEAGVGIARAWLAMRSAYDLARERRVEHKGVRRLATS